MFKDIKIDNDNDLDISNGDLSIYLSDNQHISDVVNSNKGEWKQHPLLGAGLPLLLNSNLNTFKISNTIRKELSRDGYTVNNVVIDDDNSIKINATR